MAKTGAVGVTVNKGVSISVSPTPVTIDKGDNVQWTGADSTPFDIVLPGGEPNGSCGLSGSKYVCTSGGFQNNTHAKRTVKYTVTSQGRKALDPDIDIQP